MGPIFTDRELDIMTVLWQRRSGTAAEVRAALDDPLAYNTVLTMLGILEEKGFVRRAADGRAFRYYPTVRRSVAKRSAVRRIVTRLFEGDPRLLVTQLVSDRSLSSQDLLELRRLRDRQVRKTTEDQ